MSNLMIRFRKYLRIMAMVCTLLLGLTSTGTVTADFLTPRQKDLPEAAYVHRDAEKMESGQQSLGLPLAQSPCIVPS